MRPTRLAARAVLGALVLGMVPGALGAPALATADLYRDYQWGLERVNAPQAWDKGRGRGVTIAVVDTGIDLDHEDLAPRVDKHVTCIGANADPTQCRDGGVDDHGHGTHVAGIAAASAGNGKGIAGVAPEARLMAVRVLRREVNESTGEVSARGDVGDIRAGILWAVDHGADVVNLSLGENVVLRNLLGSSLESAVEYAWDNGAIPVIASGNKSGDLFSAGYASLPALVVTATDPENDQADYATNVGGAQWGMAAPGGEGGNKSIKEREILSTHWKRGEANSYAFMEGTSMATPHVAGAAAVLLSAGLDPDDVVARLTSTATDLGDGGKDTTFGWGLLNLAAATRGLPDLPPVHRDPPAPAPDVSAASAGDINITVGTPAPPPTSAPARPSGVYRMAAPPPGDAGEKVAQERPLERGRRGKQRQHDTGQALPVGAEDGGPGTAPFVWAGLGTLALAGVVIRRAVVR